MKKSKLLLILAAILVLTLVVFASCGKCKHETYGAWQLTKAPTLEQAGTAIRVCDNGDNVETTAVVKLTDKSVWTASQSTATHTSAGTITYTSTDFGSVTISVDRLDDHVYDKTVAEPQYLVSEANCTTAATYRKSCVCGAVGTATFTSGNALGHDGQEVAEVAAVHTATALTNGVAAHYECSRCHKLYSDAECTTEVTAESLVIAVAHSYGDIELVTEPTCTVAGAGTITCKDCEKTENVVIAALGHDFTSNTYVSFSVVEGGADPDDYHALKCDRCGAVLTDETHRQEHNMVNYYFALDNKGYVAQVCTVCARRNTSNQTLVNNAEFSDATVWEAGKTVAATYEHGEYTAYTLISSKGSDNVIVINNYTSDALIPVYNNQIYTATEVDLTASNNVDKTEGSLSITTRSTAKLTIGAAGLGTSNGTFPFYGDKVAITVTDQIRRTVSVAFSGDSRSKTHAGYLDQTTGLMVLAKDGVYDQVYVLTMYPTANNTSNYETYLLDRSTNSTLIAYTDATARTTNILIVNDEVYFGVTTNVAISDITTETDTIEVSLGGNVVAAYVRDAKGALKLCDSARGTYTGEMGTLTVDGIGGFVLGSYSGTYTANSNGTYDVYVVANDVRVDHYTTTLAEGAYTLVRQTISVTLNAGEQGTIDADPVTLATNCVITAAPTVTDNTYEFVGWALEANGEVLEVLPADATTLYAVYAKKVTLHVVDSKGGNIDIVVGSNETIASKLPAYNGMSVNATNNTIFGGWYLDDEYNTPLDTEATPVVADEGRNIYAQWVQGGYWEAFQDNANKAEFVYDAGTNAWKTTNLTSTVRYTRFEAINGDIVISFKYYVVGAYADYISIKNDGTTVVAELHGNAANASTPKDFVAVVKSGKKLEIITKCDTPATEGKGVYLADMTINGKPITVTGVYDLKNGEYTGSGAVLELDGNGNYTWGEVSGTYTVDRTNTNILKMTVVESGNIVGGYQATLNGSTYSIEPLKVTVTYVCGLSAWADRAKFGTVEVEVNAYELLTLSAPAQAGYVVDRYSYETNTVTSITPTADCEVRVIYAPAVNVTYHYGVNDMTHVQPVKTGAAIGDLHALPDTVTNGDKEFSGWYSQDGSSTGEWGDKITASTVVSEAMDVYAKWADAAAWVGAYQGYQFGFSGPVSMTNSTVKKIFIDADGNVTGDKTGSLKTKEDGTMYFQDGTNERKMMFSADHNAIIFSVNSAANTTNAYLLVRVSKTETSDVKIAGVETYNYLFNDSAIGDITRASIKLGTFMVNGEQKVVYCNGSELYYDVALTDSTGNAMTFADLQSATTVVLTNSAGLNVTLTYSNKNITAVTENA